MKVEKKCEYVLTLNKEEWDALCAFLGGSSWADRMKLTERQDMADILGKIWDDMDDMDDVI